jgi:hypothetical protein
MWHPDIVTDGDWLTICWISVSGQDLADAMLVGISDDIMNAPDFFEGLWFCLSIAAGYYNPGARIGADGAAHGLAGLHRGLLRYRAGVDNGYLGCTVVSGRHPIVGFQLPGYGIGFGLVHLTAQCADFKRRHLIPDDTVFCFETTSGGSQNRFSISILN